MIACVRSFFLNYYSLKQNTYMQHVSNRIQNNYDIKINNVHPFTLETKIRHIIVLQIM